MCHKVALKELTAVEPFRFKLSKKDAQFFYLNFSGVNMNIGIDLDGVIFKNPILCRNQSKLFDWLFLTGKDTNLDANHYLKLPKKILQKASISFIKFLTKNPKLVDDAKETILKLQKNNHKLIIISARGIKSLKELDGIDSSTLLFLEKKILNFQNIAGDKLTNLMLAKNLI